MTDGHMNDPVWIGLNFSDAEDIYFEEPDGDGSYDELNDAVAIKVSYSGNHSAITTSETNIYISKWGQAPLMRHNKNYCPDIYGNPDRFWLRSVDVPQDYSTIQAALNAAVSGQIVHVESHTVSGDVLVASGKTLKLVSGSIINLNSHTIVSTSGTITVESGATLNPDIRLQSGSAIKGLYPTIASAFTAATSGQWVHIRGTHTFTDHFTVSSGKVLKTESGTQMNFASNKYLYVYGNLYGVSSTYTGSSGTWGGIKYYSGSSGSIQYSNINNAYVAVYANNSNPTVSHNNISNCTYGIYAFYGSPVISNCTISNDLVKNVEV
jgi:parallel beta-helix repeat protein